MDIKKALGKITDEFYFKIAILPFSILYVLPFTTLFVGSILKVFLAWGALVIAAEFIKNKNLLKDKRNIMLLAFIACSFIGVAANFRNNFTRNLLDWLYLAVFSFSLFYVSPKKNYKQAIHEIKVFSMEFIVISSIISFLSLLIFIFNFKRDFTVGKSYFLMGTFENRLFGFLGNPNSGALIALLSIIASFIVLAILKKDDLDVESKKKSSKHINKFLIFNIAIQFPVFFLSNSRSAVVALTTAVIIFMFLVCKNYMPKKFKTVKQKYIAMTMLVLFLSASTVVGAEKIVNGAMSGVPVVVYQIKQSFSDKDIENPSEPPKLSAMEREHLTDDVTNGRFEIWGAGFSVLKNNLLTGVGNDNILENANKFLPVKFVKKSPEIASNMHNVYLQILVSGGILPLLAFAAFILLVAVKTFKSFSNKLKLQDFLIRALMFSLVAALLVENLFDSNIIGFMNLPIVVCFWSVLGYVNKLSGEREEK